ncbi:hypothetical protein D3C76_1531720 [compost metagenome]
MIEQLLHHLDRRIDVVALKVGIEAEHAAVTKALALHRRAIGQAVAQAQLIVQDPVQVAREQVEGLLVVVVQYRLDEQPMQLGAVAQQAPGQITTLFGLLADAFEVAALFRFGGR